MEDTSCRQFFTDADSTTYHRQYEAFAPSSSTAWRRTTSLTDTVIRIAACGNWSISSGPRSAPARWPPFSRAEGRPAGAHRSRSLAPPAHTGRRRCPELLVPRHDGAVGDPRRGTVRLLAAPGPTGFRRTGPAGRLSRLRHGPGYLGPAESPRLETDRQGTAQSYQRLQFRRSPGALRRLEHLAQGDLRHRLFVPHGPGASTAVARRMALPALAPAASRPDAFSLDFHAVPHRGEDNGLENHYVPMRGQAVPSVLMFFAQAVKSRLLCYSDATVTRDRAAGQLIEFVEFCRSILGSDPTWLYFDSRLTTYAEMDRLNRRGRTWFITIRRRGRRILRELAGQPASAWRRTVIDTPRRRHRNIRYLEQTIRVAGFRGGLRQIAVTGLGRDQPTLVLSNNFEATARQILTRYTGAMGSRIRWAVASTSSISTAWPAKSRSTPTWTRR